VSVTVHPAPADDPAFGAVRERVGYAAPDEPVPTGARRLVARRDGEAVARLALLTATDLMGAPGRSGVLGWYEATDREAGVELLRAARASMTDDVARMVGPINASTWGRYRLALPSDLAADPPFLSEPVNPPEYAEHFREAGFRAAAEYESAVVEDLAVGDARAAEYAAGWAARGGALRPLDPGRFEAELEAIFRLSLRAFATNRYYAPIGFDEFRARYLPLRPLLDPELVRLAVDGHGALLGFAFAFPDPWMVERGRPSRVVLKTLATAPEARGAGLGTLLTDEVRRIAHAKAYRAVIHALMEAGNASVRISRHSARVFRRYTVFEADR
jgi:GNAT superfamily N-acetyltransferase